MTSIPTPSEIPEDMRLPLYIAKREPTELGIDRVWLNVKLAAISDKLKAELKEYIVKFKFTPDGHNGYESWFDMNLDDERVIPFFPTFNVSVNVTVHVHGTLIAQFRLPLEAAEEKQPVAPTASNPCER